MAAIEFPVWIVKADENFAVFKVSNQAGIDELYPDGMPDTDYRFSTQDEAVGKSFLHRNATKGK